ncbi:hypothetical protein ACFFS2_17275 [Streptomyces aurantiacus]|uniref:Uncharacterized protein n=1 Tax=Streptomyces aurantiacus TaxID=47760 RepID=A0A7G1PD81_9ACTN|nr:hypothetical protein [Streptomyces aurantiacus]BCL31746.1 hypothetical protein GCM10017557_66050 [Streptomyces aurantiacus]
MSDPLGGRPEEERASRAPDFFDRLLARHTPAAVPPANVVRLRPRLAGPFERAEAVRADGPDPEQDTRGPLWPTSNQVPRGEGDVADSTVREIQFRTERERTVVRPGRAPSDEPASRPPARDLPETPLLRPATVVVPAPRPVPDAARRTAGRGEPERAFAQSAVSVSLPSGADAVPPAAVSAALRPSVADTAAARDAVRQGAGRRPGRGGEQVVQVQIGRLEVTAAGASPGNGDGSRRPAPTGRPAASLSLADYLARGSQ